MKQKVSLIKLMKENRFDLVRILVCYEENKDFEFDVNERDEEGYSVLDYAILYDKEGIALSLLERHHCCFINGHGEGIKIYSAGLAIKFHRYKVLKKMIELQSFGDKPKMYFVHSGASKDYNLLMYAVVYKNLDAVKLLLDNGAQIGIGRRDGMNALSIAAIRAVDHGEHSTQNLIFRELLKRLKDHGAKEKIISRALDDLRAYAQTLDEPSITGKIEAILESARMY